MTTHRSLQLARASVIALLCLAPAVNAVATDMQEVIRAALADYPSIAAVQSQRRAASARIAEAWARHLPVLDIGATTRIQGMPPSGPLPRLRMNVFAGGSIEALVDRETLLEQSLASREAQVRDEVALGAGQAYLRLLRALRVAQARRASVTRHERLAADFEQIARMDPGRRHDLVQARSRLSVAQGQLEDATAEVASARTALARFYPHPVDDASMALPQTWPMGRANAVAASLDETVAGHPAVRAARDEFASAEANVRVLRLQRGPRVDFEAQGGLEPLSRLVLSWPVLDRTLSAAEQGAAAALLGAQAGVRESELEVAESLARTRDDHAAAVGRLTQARAQADIDRELVEIYFAQFRIGRRNLLDLLSAFSELASAEARLAASEVDVALAGLREAWAAGQLAGTFSDGAMR